MNPTTRMVCPLDCGWHHDSRNLPELAGLSGNTIEDIIRARIQHQNQADEDTIREHPEMHPLIEWVKKVNHLQQRLAGAEADVQLAMDEWGKSDRHHAEKSVAMAAERGAWGTTRQRVWNAAFVVDEEDVTDWQRGYRACSVRVLAALDEPVEHVIYDFTAALPTPATGAGLPGSIADIPLTSRNTADIEGPGQ